MEEKDELVKPTKYEKIPMERCHLYMCCYTCEHFVCNGMSFPDGYCKKTNKNTDATRHCKVWVKR